MPESILDIIQHKLIPWVESGGLEHIIVARAQLKAMKRRNNFSFTPQKLCGPRVGVRSFEFVVTTAKWPQDHLLETPSPLLLFVIDGKADLHIGDYWLHAAQGQGIFILGDVPRKDGTEPYLHPKNRRDGFCSTINFSECRGRLQIWLNRCEGEIRQGFNLPTPLYTFDDRALQLLNQMQHYFVETDIQNDVICLYLLKAFLLILQNDLRAGRFVQVGLLNTTERMIFDNYDPIHKAQEYVRTHLHESLTIQGVARRVHLSRTLFALRFRKETGRTFNQFVTECRMEQAKVLLRDTDYTLTFVCNSVGYRTLAYFHRVFLKHAGSSPQEFRCKERLTQNKYDKINS